MPRHLRVEFPGAIYHVLNRGDRREPIFKDDQDRRCFISTLGESCGKTEWQVHAVCLMPNHFHLVLETPQANLAAGMHWFMSTYTARFNRRHKLTGHLFSGRYKSLIVDGSGNGYLKTVCDYVHLNPSRARLLPPEQPLRDYPWSSWPDYLKSAGQRPTWLRVDRLLGEYHLEVDSPPARRRLESALEERRGMEAGDNYKAIRRGWFFGEEAAKDQLLEQTAAKAGSWHFGEAVHDSELARAEGIVREELKKRKWNEQTLAERRKGDPEKVAIAQRLRGEATVTQTWIAERLQMGTRTHVAHLLYWEKRGEREEKHNTID